MEPRRRGRGGRRGRSGRRRRRRVPDARRGPNPPQRGHARARGEDGHLGGPGGDPLSGPINISRGGISGPADGGDGAPGAAGATGGVGGGGAGGTVRLVASAFTVDGTTVIDTTGGLNGDGLSRGDNGQFQFGSNSGAPSPTLVGVDNVFNVGAGLSGSDPYLAVPPSAYTVQLADWGTPGQADFGSQVPTSGRNLIVVGGTDSFFQSGYLRLFNALGQQVADLRVGPSGVGAYLMGIGVLNPTTGQFVPGSTLTDAQKAEIVRMVTTDYRQQLDISTPVVAGFAGGANTYGLVSDPNLLAALRASSPVQAAVAAAPAGAVATVIRETIPAGFDQYTGYDLVLFVNLTGVTLATPKLGITQFTADPSFLLDLQAGGLLGTTAQRIGALPAHGIFALLVRQDFLADGQFANASLGGPIVGVTGASLTPGVAHYLTLPPTAAPPPAQLRTYSVTFSGMDALTLTATGGADNVFNLVRLPSVNRLTVDLSAASGDNTVNVLDTAGGVSGMAVTVATGSGDDLVSVHAAQPGHAFTIATGAGADTFVLTGTGANGGSSVQVDLGANDDSAQVTALDLSPTLTLHINGGDGTDTLRYDAAGNPTNPGTPATPDGSLTLQTVSVATVSYQSIEGIPGFVGATTSAGGAYTIDQGQGLALNGSATAATNTQIVAIAWDLDGDGVYTDATGATPTVDWPRLRSLGLGLAGTYPVGMQVTSTVGTSYEFTTVTVNRVAPTVSVAAPATADVARPYTVTFGATFAGGERPSAFVVTWGDGSSTTLPADASAATHTYLRVGNYSITVGVQEGGTTTDAVAQPVTVGVNPTSLHADGPTTIDAGGALTLTVTADGAPTTAQLDLLGQGTYSAASASFTDNGDGTSTATLTLPWTQLQAAGVSAPGAYPAVTVRAVYGATTLTSAATTLTVNDVAPTAAFTGSATEGGPGSVSFTSVYHPSATAGFRYSYDVGNTGTFQVVDSASPTFALPADAVAASGSVVVRGRGTSPTGSSSEYVLTVLVTDQPPAFVTADGDRTVNANEVVSLTAVSFTDPGQDTVTATVDWGDGNNSVGVVETTGATAPTTGTVAASHVFAYRPQPYTVTITLQDAAGATATHTFDVTVLDPTLTAVTVGDDVVTTEGNHVQLAGTFTDPGAPSTYRVTVDWGDGTVNTAPQVVAPRTAADLGHVLDSHYYGQDGTYTVTMTVTKAGQAPVVDTFTVTVNNVDPIVQVAPLPPTGPGVPVTFTATFTDPSFPVGGQQETYQAVVTWGDGTSSPATVVVTPGSPGVPTTGTITATHPYAGNGPYAVSVQVNDGGSGPATYNVGGTTLTNAPPTVVAGGDLSAPQGGSVPLSVPFSDLGFNYGGTGKSFTATIDWGDGTTSDGVVTVTPGNASTPTTGTVTGSHSYATFGTFPVVVTVTDEGGASTTVTLQAVIDNVAPTLATLPAGGIGPDGVFVLRGQFTDAGLADGHTVTIDWGDGTSTTFDADTQGVDASGNPLVVLAAPTATAAGTFQMGHVYADAGNHTVTVTVTDSGGLSSQQSRTYSSAPLQFIVTPPVNPDEGRAFSGPVAAFSKPGRVAGDFTAPVVWGDGQTSTVSGSDGGIVQNADGSFSVRATHTYADDATGLSFSVEVTDQIAGSQFGDGGTVDVRNVAPTVTLNPVAATPEGGSAVLSGQVTDPGLNDSHTVQISWGDPLDGRDSLFALAATSGLQLNQTYSSLNDNAVLTITGLDQTAGRVEFEVRHSYADDRDTGTPAVYPIAVQAQDNAQANATASTTVAVSDVAPTVALTGRHTVLPRTWYRLQIASPVDPGADTVTHYRINWGDNRTTLVTAAQLTRLARTVMHQYLRAGVYRITVDVQDEGGWHRAAGTASVTVWNPQIQITSGGFLNPVWTLTGLTALPPAVSRADDLPLGGDRPEQAGGSHGRRDRRQSAATVDVHARPARLVHGAADRPRRQRRGDHRRAAVVPLLLPRSVGPPDIGRLIDSSLAGGTA
ncbi:MAG: PKD domain-containing protein [Gemmataceae bacterium]